LNAKKTGALPRKVGVYDRPRMADVRNRLPWLIAIIMAIIAAVFWYWKLHAR